MQDWAEIAHSAEVMHALLKGTEDFDVRIGRDRRIIFTDPDFEAAIPLDDVIPGSPGVSAIITSTTIWVRDADVVPYHRH